VNPESRTRMKGTVDATHRGTTPSPARAAVRIAPGLGEGTGRPSSAGPHPRICVAIPVDEDLFDRGRAAGRTLDVRLPADRPERPGRPRPVIDPATQHRLGRGRLAEVRAWGRNGHRGDRRGGRPGAVQARARGHSIEGGGPSGRGPGRRPSQGEGGPIVVRDAPRTGRRAGECQGRDGQEEGRGRVSVPGSAGRTGIHPASGPARMRSTTTRSR
jgi:hypothetical protein